MKKGEYYLLVIILFAFFILIMNGGNLLKQPLSAEDNFMFFYDRLELNIINQNWEKAVVNNEKLNQAWNKIVPRIQFSVEKDEINAINVNLARLQAALTSRDPVLALTELSEMREHWENLNR